ncbi:MAG: hypothetical protein JEZ09_18720 [Salinivirgaceae bacterium]|nr:hypothetical protein [Salinivirgaceae bacterium]
MSDYLLCENPLNPGRLFVLKNSEPKCLVECDFIHEDVDSDNIANKENINELFSYLNTDGDIENWQLTIVQYFEGLPNGDEKLAKKYKKSLQQTWEWFHKYLQWDEKNVIDAEHDDYLGSVN